jgi:hypothetical protein
MILSANDKSPTDLERLARHIAILARNPSPSRQLSSRQMRLRILATVQRLYNLLAQQSTPAHTSG